MRRKKTKPKIERRGVSNGHTDSLQLVEAEPQPEEKVCLLLPYLVELLLTYSPYTTYFMFYRVVHVQDQSVKNLTFVESCRKHT
jgi:hypothetical protein